MPERAGWVANKAFIPRLAEANDGCRCDQPARVATYPWRQWGWGSAQRDLHGQAHRGGTGGTRVQVDPPAAKVGAMRADGIRWRC